MLNKKDNMVQELSTQRAIHRVVYRILVVLEGEMGTMEETDFNFLFLDPLKHNQINLVN